MSSPFLAGAARQSIMPTPELMAQSPGCFPCTRKGEEGSPLQVKALAMSCGVQRWLHVSLDLCVLMNWNYDLIRDTIARDTGLALNEIVVAITHSHSAPYVTTRDAADPYVDFIRRRTVEAAVAAWNSRVPARIGHGGTWTAGDSFNQRVHVTGASFNQRIAMPDGGVYFTRDYREGLAAGRLVDPRLTVVRIDTLAGRPIAGWVRFAAHPACVIFDAPLSAEYPGYMTERLSETVAQGAPVLFGYGVSGDVNCIPMFGKEEDSRTLGLNLASLAGPVFERIRTTVPLRMSVGSRVVDLPLDPAPSIEALDKEIAEVRAFIADLDRDPALVWILGVNCWKTWSVAQKKRYAAPLAEWAEKMKDSILAGRTFPRTWPSNVAALIVDEIALVFQSGELFTVLGLSLAARSPLPETLLMAWGNGGDGYLGTDEDKQRGGYEIYTSVRTNGLEAGLRPLPYASGAAEYLLREVLEMIEEMARREV